MSDLKQMLARHAVEISECPPEHAYAVAERHAGEAIFAKMILNQDAYPTLIHIPNATGAVDVYQTTDSLRDYFAIHASAEDIQIALDAYPFDLTREQARYVVADKMVKARRG